METKDKSSHDLYRAMTEKRVAFLSIVAILIVVLFIVNLLINLSAGTTLGLKALFTPDSVSPNLKVIMWYVRVPNSLWALMVGIALGMAGAEMQTVLNNPLAEPYTLGISSAASFGAALVIGLGVGTDTFGTYATTIMAFLCSMVVCSLVFIVIQRKSSDRTTVVLVGVAMLFLFQALVNLIQSISGRDAANGIMFWMFGSLSRNASYESLTIEFVVIICVIILFALNAWKLTSLKLGDNKVSSLGINVQKLRRNMIVGISLVTAVSVSFTGTIGFVGLVGPHIARMLVGDDQRFFLPMSAMCGAVMLLAASIVCKLTIFTSTLPVGVVTSLIGVPFFVYLIFRKGSVIA